MSPLQSIGLYRAQGIVLRSMKLGEADRIVTFYTQTHGRLRGVAKGVRKSKSRFGGRLDAFTLVDLQLYKGRSDLDIISQAEIITRPKRMRSDYAAFCAASAMADAIDRTTPERDRNIPAFLLLRTALQAVEDGSVDPSLLAYAFLAKLTAMAGLQPTLRVCVECGSEEVVGFSFARGGTVCAGCVERADPKSDEAVMDAWTMLLESDWPALRTHSLEPALHRQVGQIVLGFVQWHTETRFRAFNLLPSSFAQ